MLKLNEWKKEKGKAKEKRDGSVGGKLLSQVQYTNNNNNNNSNKSYSEYMLHEKYRFHKSCHQ